jgi:hypothetical protein
MKTDTHERAAKVQLELRRRMTPERRLELMDAFSRDIIQLSREALRERFPDERELRLEWVRLHYGEDLAKRLREFQDGLDRNTAP